MENIDGTDLEKMIESVCREGNFDGLLKRDEHIVVLCDSKRFNGASVGTYSVDSILNKK